MYNYNKLRGRIVEKQLSHSELALKINITPATLSTKLNNHRPFTQDEIFNIARILKIENIEEYFFVKI